jgi:ATP-dependent exoDNAse (exonuclease V) beta subunit
MKAERPKLLFHKAESGGDQHLEFTLIKKDSKNYFESKGYQALKSGEHFASIMEELSRLIYVACTRAKDHLILSTIAEPSSETSSTPSRGKRLNQAMEFINSYFDDFAGYEVAQKDSQGPAIGYREISIEELERVKHVRELSAELVMRAPSTHHKGEASSKGFKKSFAKDEKSPDGRPLGRAVHGVMESIMLGSGIPTQNELDHYISKSVAKEQAEEVVEEVRSRISALLANAEILEALSSSLRWPELHLAKQVNEGSIRFVEGFADLVYKAADGYVLVDYKTDGDLEASMAHYEEQLGAYADILKDIIGEPLARVLIVHAKTEKAVTRPVKIAN